jgi:hypothetical protein
VKGMRAIMEGLKKEDWVVVNGIQRARPGAQVTPVQEENQDPSEGKAEEQPEAKPEAKPDAEPKSKSAKTASSPKR